MIWRKKPGLAERTETMTNFEHMKKAVLSTVSALDEEELRQLVMDACMDDGGNEAVFSCGICEAVFGDCYTLPEGNGCMKKYLDWCSREYVPEPAWEDKKVIVNRLSELLKATRIGSGIDRLTLSADRKKVKIRYANGSGKLVNIDGDSGYAIIKDVMKVL